jgi:hypothetical protein
MPGPLKDFFVILLGEVPRKLMNATQVQLPTFDHAKNAGKSTGRAAGSDTFRSDGFRHAKPLHAERKHRGTRVLEVQLPPIDFADIGKHGGRIATVSLNQGREVAKQVFFVEVPKRRAVNHSADAIMGVSNPRTRL